MVIDPYRTLGLHPGASASEVKAAYRRLAKIHHPDTAGPGAMPRFLAIQAAYEAILGRHPESRAPGGGTTGRREAWQADPERARSTRASWRRSSGRWSSRTAGAPGAAGEEGTAGPAGAADAGRPRPGASPGEATGGGRRAGPGADRGRTSSPSGRERGSRKATLGSTSYDDAEREPFDPEWAGAAWYGQGSGTYWTLNPKEYADPRKHGPEYQARGRRRGGGEAGDVDADQPTDAPEGHEAEPTRPVADGWPTASDWSTAWRSRGASGPGSPDGSGQAQATADASWGDARSTDAGGQEWSGPGDSEASATWSTRQRARTWSHPADVGAGTSGRPGPGVVESLLSRLLDGPHGRDGRALLALLGWPPIGLAAAAVIGELTGCGRYAATCTGGADSLAPAIWLVQLVVLGLLLALPPRVTALAVGGTLAMLVAAVPAAVLLSIAGGTRDRDAASTVLVAILAVAWIFGVAIAWRRRQRLAEAAADDWASRTMAG